MASKAISHIGILTLLYFAQALIDIAASLGFPVSEEPHATSTEENFRWKKRKRLIRIFTAGGTSLLLACGFRLISPENGLLDTIAMIAFGELAKTNSRFILDATCLTVVFLAAWYHFYAADPLSDSNLQTTSLDLESWKIKLESRLNPLAQEIFFYHSNTLAAAIRKACNDCGNVECLNRLSVGGEPLANRTFAVGTSLRSDKAYRLSRTTHNCRAVFFVLYGLAIVLIATATLTAFELVYSFFTLSKPAPVGLAGLVFTLFIGAVIAITYLSSHVVDGRPNGVWRKHGDAINTIADSEDFSRCLEKHSCNHPVNTNNANNRNKFEKNIRTPRADLGEMGVYPSRYVKGLQNLPHFIDLIVERKLRNISLGDPKHSYYFSEISNILHGLVHYMQSIEDNSEFTVTLFLVDDSGACLVPRYRESTSRFRRPIDWLETRRLGESRFSTKRPTSHISECWLSDDVIVRESGEVAYFDTNQKAYIGSLVCLPITLSDKLNFQAGRQKLCVNKKVGVLCLDSDSRNFFRRSYTARHAREIRPFIKRIIFEYLSGAARKNSNTLIGENDVTF